MSVLQQEGKLIFLKDVKIVYQRTKVNGDQTKYEHRAGYCKVLHKNLLGLESVQTASSGLESHVLVLGVDSDVLFEPLIEKGSEIDLVQVLKRELVGKKFSQVVVHVKKMSDWVAKNVRVNSVTDDGIIKFVSGGSSFENEIDVVAVVFARFTI